MFQTRNLRNKQIKARAFFYKYKKRETSKQQQKLIGKIEHEKLAKILYQRARFW